MKSVLQEEKECLVCGRKDQLHFHHVFFGTADRRMSEKYGMKVWLCYEHHTGNAGVHFNKALDLKLKRFAQEQFEAVYGAEIRFRDVFGKNYI